MKTIKPLLTSAAFIIVSLAATTGAFAQDATASQAENAGLRTVVNAQKQAAPTYANVPLLADADHADVELLKDEYAKVELLKDEKLADVKRLDDSTSQLVARR